MIDLMFDLEGGLVTTEGLPVAVELAIELESWDVHDPPFLEVTSMLGLPDAFDVHSIQQTLEEERERRTSAAEADVLAIVDAFTRSQGEAQRVAEKRLRAQCASTLREFVERSFLRDGEFPSDPVDVPGVGPVDFGKLRLWAAYLRTIFDVHGPHGAIPIRVGETHPEVDRLLSQHGCERWCFITASKPGSVILSDQTNRARNNRLRADLAAANYTVFPGAGHGADPSWAPEDRLLVLGIPRDRALELGRRWGQNAIVWGEIHAAARLIDSSSTPSPWQLPKGLHPE